MVLIEPADAFEIYYAFGASRSIAKLHKKIHQDTPDITPAEDTLKRWSIRHKWQKQIVIRDNAAYDGVAEKMTEARVDMKMKELEQLDRTMSEIDAVMPMIFDALQSCTVTDPKTGEKRVRIVPETTQDMVALYKAQTGFANAKVKLVETVRKIMGEDTGGDSQVTLKVQYENPPENDD